MRIRIADNRNADSRRAASWHLPVTLRLATEADEPAIARLAELDSSRAPTEPRLVAERAGAIEAVISLVDRETIADPFRHTAELVALLRCHAGERPAGPETVADPAAALVATPRVAQALAGAGGCA